MLPPPRPHRRKAEMAIQGWLCEPYVCCFTPNFAVVDLPAQRHGKHKTKNEIDASMQSEIVEPKSWFRIVVLWSLSEPAAAARIGLVREVVRCTRPPCDYSSPDQHQVCSRESSKKLARSLILDGLGQPGYLANNWGPFTCLPGPVS